MSVQNVAIDVVPEVLPVPTAFEAAKVFFFSNPLLNRISDWKIIVMDCSTVIAVTCAFVTFVSGTTILCAAMTTVAFASAIGAFYMRQFVVLGDLQETARRFTDLAHHLEEENARLKQTSQEILLSNGELLKTNGEILLSNGELRQTNEKLLKTKDELLEEIKTLKTSNEALSKHVADLAIHADVLSGSATIISKEMDRFTTQNWEQGQNTDALKESLKVVYRQILDSKALCELVTGQMSEKKEELGLEMTKLRKCLEELRSENSVSTKIEELNKLQKHLLETSEKLHTVEKKFEKERGNFEGLCSAMHTLREQFSKDIGETGKDLRTSLTQNNQDFRDTLAQMQMIAQMYLSPNTPQGRSKASTPVPIRSPGNSNPLFIA